MFALSGKMGVLESNSNTTLVKVKWGVKMNERIKFINSNTTLVKVK